MLQIDLKNCTDLEIKFALSSALFVWMIRGDRIWGMLRYGNVWKVKQIVEMIRTIDANAEEWFNVQGIELPKYEMCDG